MKVAMVSFDGGEYGVQLSSALVRHTETRVKLIISSETGEPHLEALDSAVELTLYNKPRMRQALKSVRLMLRIQREITEFEPDVVHIQHHQLWFYLLLLTRLCRRFPCVTTVHDPIHHVGDRESQLTPQSIIHNGYHQADQLIVHATHAQHQLVNKLGFDQNSVHVIPHIAVSNSGDPPPDVEEDDRLILFFGRIWEYKGLEYLIRAEPMISARVPGLKIMIAGRGEDFARYRVMMNNPDRFIVHNTLVPWDEAARHFARASIVVLPYTDASSSGVIPVAYAFNKPVISTSVGGLPDMVDDGVTGFLVPPRDPEALARATITLLEDPELRHEMGRRGKEKLIRECGPDVVAHSTASVYALCIGSKSPGRSP